MTTIKAPALTVAYVVKGFCQREVALKKTEHPCLTDGHISEIDLFTSITELADLVEEKWQALPDGEWCGVWDYEVSEEFGSALYDHHHEEGTLPREEEALLILDRIVSQALTAGECAHG